MQKRGVRVRLCEANTRVKGKLARAGLLEIIGPESYVDDFGQALAQCRSVMESPGQAMQQKKRRFGAAAQRLIKTSEDFFPDGK